VILFDTSILSRVFRRRTPGAEEKRLQAIFEDLMAGDDSLGLPGTVLQEVLSGIRSTKQFEALQRRLLSAFTIVLPTASDYIEAAALRNRCLAAGVSASGPDCLIAVMAISGNHELFAADRDFEEIAKHSTLKLFPVQKSV
jgi:predicted nucleic acid-binding protein